jgi:hypothetical protein
MNITNFRSSMVKRGKGRPVEVYLPDNQKLMVPRDSREQGDGTYAFGLEDTTPGKMPMLAMATGAVPVEHLQELLARAREEPDLRPPPISMEQWNIAWQEHLKAARDHEVGRRRFYQYTKQYKD